MTMDNYFEILGLLLFILFNILAGYQNKKKREQNERKPDLDQEETAILEDYSKEEVAEEIENVESEKQIFTHQEQKIAEKVLEEENLVDKLDFQGYEKSSKYNKFRPLINKIKDPENIREYIVVSEILNKPKALRK